MREIHVKYRDRGKPLLLTPGEKHRIVLLRMRRRFVEMEEANFHFDSAVLLPDGPEEASRLESMDGLAVIEAALAHARDNPNQRLLVAGHTDTSGRASYNLGLSRVRAENVYAALIGDRDRWSSIAAEHHQEEDVLCVLAWVASVYGLRCAPASVREAKSPTAARQALCSFQREYNRVYRANLEPTGEGDQATWEAIFELYETELRRRLRIDAAGLQQLRAGLCFVEHDALFIGCGEHHPISQAGGDGRQDAKNRRVEVLFFEPDEQPRLSCHPSPGSCDPGSCELYDAHVYSVQRLSPHADPFDLTVRLLADPHGHLAHRDELLLQDSEGGVQRVEVPTECESFGDYVEVTFPRLDPRLRYTLSTRCEDEERPRIILNNVRGVALRARAWIPADATTEGDEEPPEDDASVVDDGPSPWGVRSLS